MNKSFPPPILYCFLMFLIPCLLLPGCAFLQVREDVNILQKSTVFVGIVSNPLSYQDMPVVVAAYSKKNKMRTIVHYTTLHEPGPYELMVPTGTHNIVAFGDTNKNLIYDDEEPAGQILSAEQVSAPSGGVYGHLDIVIKKQDVNKIDLPVGFKMPPKEYKGFHSTSPGAIANMDDILFSDEYGKKGFWEGLEFFREIGGNVYFIEEYDPDKIPILFVHGAGGSPQNWITFFDNIDREKYQPWFFYYPSGSSLDSMSHLLFWKLQNLQTKYKFKELHITAHSMGGLVVRSFMVNYGPLFPSITNFISISTPWGGEELAELGVKYSPAVIPAWRDMQPGSEFINSIFRKKIPPAVDHYLFFGHKGNRNILRPNNDKVVTLASQLDLRSQRDAKMIYGFNEDHVSILSSNQVISQYNSILADIYQKSKALNTIQGNRMNVDFSFEFPEDLPRPETGLYLRPVDKKGAATWIYLSPEDTGREHGPFPPGKYEASIIAPAFVPDPVRIPVTIQEGRIPRIQFSLKPVGFIRGYIPKKDKSYSQAGENLLPDGEVEIQSITLKGDGVYRTLTPLNEGQSYSDLYPEYYLSKKDFTSQGAFFFFGLPAGKYELIMNVKGYKPYIKALNVRPGIYQDTIVIELVKEAAFSK
ncbi:lipase family alpha/beta hydrolase [Thermodesulfobacteriota bacterium]